MLRYFAALALIQASLVAGSARADGLMYQLPEDGAWVRFDMEITEGNDSVRKASVVMRSVGRALENEAARWLELQVPQEEGTKIIKLLIPERRLKGGESPLEHMVRGWSKQGEDNPVSLPNARDFWLQVFLAGPLGHVEKLESTLVDGPLGQLECQGLIGKAHVREEDGFEEDLSYTIRRHEKSPFGVVTCVIDCVVKKGGKLHGKSIFALTLAEVGKDARSELRGYE